ncbi:MAG: hypothetical protein VX463_18995, partial [Pseudomonadota bacterium]|nr:hypothetical protein [Pseudomonadota bacterium]
HVLIFDGSEPLDAADDPASLGEWGVTASGALTHVTGGIYDVTVGDLSIALAAGDYFIGLTPVYPFSSGGQSYQFTSTATEGDSWFIRNPGDGFGTGSAWYSGTAYTGYEKHDMVMTIEGEVAAPAVPLPAPALLLGAGVLALAGAARRRVSRA